MRDAPRRIRFYASLDQRRGKMADVVDIKDFRFASEATEKVLGNRK